MIIRNIRQESLGDRVRIVGDVVWEDCGRPAQELWYETSVDHAEKICCNADAFLVGSIIPAMHRGEERLSMDSQVSPELPDRLATAMEWLRTWFPTQKAVAIEVCTRTTVPYYLSQRYSSSFLSGGIDSLATLRYNRLQFSPCHPYFIKECLLVYGFDINHDVDMEPAINSALHISRDVGASLIPVRTNVRMLDDDDLNFWLYQFHGAGLASVAHIFASRLNAAFVASTCDIHHMHTWGSHPLLDPNFGTASLEIIHEGARLSRLAKTRMIVDWDMALNHLRVCTGIRNGLLNCGKCEKCLRTKLALLVLGKLKESRAFSEDDVTGDELSTVRLTNAYQASCYTELIAPLTDVGRMDLVKAINKLVAGYHRFERLQRVKAVDNRYFGGYFRSTAVKILRRGDND